jgi:hypothetical protein
MCLDTVGKDVGHDMYHRTSDKVEITVLDQIIWASDAHPSPRPHVFCSSVAVHSRAPIELHAVQAVVQVTDE